MALADRIFPAKGKDKKGKDKKGKDEKEKEKYVEEKEMGDESGNVGGTPNQQQEATKSSDSLPIVTNPFAKQGSDFHKHLIV